MHFAVDAGLDCIAHAEFLVPSAHILTRSGPGRLTYSAPEGFTPAEKAHHLDRHKCLRVRSTIGAARKHQRVSSRPELMSGLHWMTK
jgi:hypothetical protein